MGVEHLVSSLLGIYTGKVARAPRVQELARILGFARIKIPYCTKVLVLVKLNA